MIGAEFRYDALDDYPGKYAVAQDYFGLSSAGETKGDNDVVEVYVEGEAPLVKGVPLIDNLTLNLSARFTDYRSGGQDVTYKAGLTWQVIPSLRFRATYGTSFRGPALYENYLAALTSFAYVDDPCQTYGVKRRAGLEPVQELRVRGPPRQHPRLFEPSGGVHPGRPGPAEVGNLKEPDGRAGLAAVVRGPPGRRQLFPHRGRQRDQHLGADNILNLCYDSSQFRNGSPYCTLVSSRDQNGNIA